MLIQGSEFTGGTFITDSAGRLMIFRSCCRKGQLEKLHKDFIKAAAAFVEACEPEKDSDIEENHRGRHWFCIAGYDRQNKDASSYFVLDDS